MTGWQMLGVALIAIPFLGILGVYGWMFYDLNGWAGVAEMILILIGILILVAMVTIGAGLWTGELP